MSNWISVKDRLPEKYQAVLIFAGGVNLASYNPESKSYRWDCDTYGFGASEVTHWMTLPEPPEKEQG